MDSEQCVMISGTNMLAADPLSPVNSAERTPQMVDWMEIWIKWKPIQRLKLIELFKHSWTVSAFESEHYPVERDSGHQGILFP